jgi:type II secretory pathway pseudopilin PulG
MNAKKAFTLIEVVGILAVLLILATLLIPATVRQIDAAAGNLESANLSKYAAALQRSIQRNRYIPGTNDMALRIASELGMDLPDITINSRANLRLFLVDPGFQIGPGQIAPPFQQTNAGCGLVGTNGYANPPVKPRLIILSNMGAVNWPSNLTTMNDVDFDTLWNTADGSLPGGGPWGGWQGQTSDVRVQRINLAPLFIHLILYNYASTNRGQYTIDYSSRAEIPNLNPLGNPINGVDAYLIKGTVLDLISGISSGAATQAEVVITRDTSFAYVQQTWQSSINLGSKVDSRAGMIGNALWSTAAAFQASPFNMNTTIKPPQVVNDMASFMTAYVNWANSGFYPAGGTNVGAYLVASNAQAILFSHVTSLASGLGTPQAAQGACTNAPLP